MRAFTAAKVGSTAALLSPPALHAEHASPALSVEQVLHSLFFSIIIPRHFFNLWKVVGVKDYEIIFRN
jgi:hypothetical protein